MRSLGFALILVSSLSGAQTTDCYRMGNDVRCDTNQGTAPATVSPYSIHDFLNDSRRANNDAVNAQMRAMERYRQQRTDEELDSQRKAAADLIIAGDCDGAAKYALSKGNFGLALEVKDYCNK